MAMAAVTPLHPRTAPLVRAGTWRRWAGFVVASGYDPHPDREYAAIRSAAALIDISPLYKYRIAGPDAVRLLDRVVTRDVTRCRVDQALYTTWCDGAGKVIDDGMVSRLDDTTFLLTGTTPSLRWLSMNAVGLDVALEDRSAATATLALQGPLSRAVLERVAEDDVASLRYFRLMHTKLAGIPAIVSRTGYTRDLGYELWVDAERAVALWDALMAAGTPDGITPAGIWALDTARIEAGHIMADVDYHSAHLALIESRKSSPFELGLGWTVSPDKGPFNGRRALEAEREARPRWRLVGLEVNRESVERLFAEHGLPPRMPAVPWREGRPVYRLGRQVGYATSGCWSPLLQQAIALAHVRAPYHEPGTRLTVEWTVEHRRRQARARVVPLPFFDPERKRA